MKEFELNNQMISNKKIDTHFHSFEVLKTSVTYLLLQLSHLLHTPQFPVSVIFRSSHSPGNGKTMLQCRGIVKELPPAKHGWTIKQAAGSLIPYVVDGESGNKKWCMELFQASENTPESNDTIPELNLDNVVPDDSSPPGAGGESKAPVAPMAGMTPGILNQLMSDSLVSVRR